MNQRTDFERRTTRTCVGCGLRDDAATMLRVALADGEVVFGAKLQRGRGAHLHPRPDCLVKAPRGLARSFKADVRVDSPNLGQRLVLSCEKRMVGLLLAARRSRLLAIGADASTAASAAGAPLVIVAVDAGSVRHSLEVVEAIRSGRAMAWKTKRELGALLGEGEVAICAVRHAGIAAELQFMRAALDAGIAATGEGDECSRRREAR